jgi:hypothetical protein
MTQAQIIKKYGQPDPKGGYLTIIDLPYPMRLAWDKDTTVKRMRCHKLAADRFKSLFNDILSEYGEDRIKELGIDIFGGVFNYRKKRQGATLSMHSWGLAIDLDPQRNSMNTPVSQANFSKPEYDKLREIFHNNGFLWGGDLWQKDCQHWQVRD